MSNPEGSWHEPQEDDDDDDSNDSFSINSSDDDELLAENSETRNSAIQRVLDDTDEGRLTPIIRKAIRRSLHRLSKSLVVDEDSDGNSRNVLIPDSDDDSDSDPVVARKARQRRIVQLDSSDEESVPEHPNVDDSSDSESVENRLRESRNSSSLESSHEEKAVSGSKAKVLATKASRSLVKKQSLESSVEEPQSIENSVEEAQSLENSVEAQSIEDSFEEAESLENSVEEAQSIENSVGAQSFENSVEVQSLENSVEVQSLGNSVEEAHSFENSVENELAMSIAIEESGSSNLDPIKAQRKAYLLLQKQQIEKKLAQTKMLYKSGKIALLPDRGERIRLSIIKDEKALSSIVTNLKNLESEIAETQTKNVPKTMFKEGSLEIDPTYLKPTTLGMPQKDLGKKAQETVERELGLTVERLKDLHGSLLGKPSEDQQAEDPRGLKVKLMPHQKYAVTWLLWRETQNPAGGVLADDMGLGKTLTMISLILASNEARNSEDGEDEEKEQWLSNARQERHLGGTLVVAPASLVAQWESEVKNRCKRGLLTVELYHGSNREENPKRLARNDLVITTYNILSRAFKVSGVLYRIRWRRVILDEAHVIRNHKSQTCESVCGLIANKRWVLTGTPVQNKEMDLFSILKFLRCSPFDDVRVWKRWVDNKNVAGHERLATVMKSIMLRRTKQELQATGNLDSLPDKTIEAIEVQLDPDERLVYDKVMVYSRTLFAQFLAQRAEKNHMYELGAGKFDKPAWLVNHKDTQFTKAQKKLLSMHADVESHEILVLLLRLRQVCCHPSLIHSMLDKEEIDETGLESVDDPSLLIKKMNDMSMYGNEEDVGETGVDKRVAEHLLTSENPVFAPERKSSKMRAVVEKIEEIIAAKDKAIVVSQWVSVLDIVANELKSVKGAHHRMFTGKVPVKDRQGIMDDFNSPHSKTNVLLLSLTAGGVGLNLVGANHLLLIDIHWNPQLECQAQDRIYRFGQKKNVFIYKYICVDTIEERIRALQEKKMEIADNLLSGGGKIASSKLSLDEMKSLFGM